MTDIDAQIQAKVEAFAKELSALVHAAALEAVASVLGTVNAPRRTNSTTQPSLPSPSHRRRRSRRGRTGAKRDPEVIAQLTERLAAHVKAHRGQGIREIGKALGASTGDLALPTKKLLAAGRITKRGEKSETRYFPARGNV